MIEATNLTKTIDVSEAQAHFNEILSLVVEGAEVILTKTISLLLAWWRSALRALGGWRAYTMTPSGLVMISTGRCQTNSGLVLNENPAGYSCLHLVGL